MQGKIVFAAILAAAAAVPAGAQPAGLPMLAQPERSASAGVYVKVPLGGAVVPRPQAGLNLRLSYEDRLNPGLQPYNAEMVDFALLGPPRPRLAVLGHELTGSSACANLSNTAGQVAVAAIVVGAIAGGVLLYTAVRDSGGE